MFNILSNEQMKIKTTLRFQSQNGYTFFYYCFRQQARSVSEAASKGEHSFTDMGIAN